ncbi:VOC family protein [Nonomuraea soli]|uniref:VOC domain-containing protein n=1 Tax=Nonomuraea soli TaxID=1032476 RepID=A0A7W0HQN1_9ACTN|nr:VOC family protein [Nonomuraea soli]MBA2892119.1 hypothetical protein [Nonomuraea soli]
MSGKVVHFEIPADNVERARAFYTEAFGWQVGPVPGMNYTMVMTAPADDQGMPTEPGAINGGMFERTGEWSGFKSPVIVIDVPSVDAALKKVEELGGTIVAPKMQVGEMGFAGYFTDSEGNVLGLWESAG